MSSDVLTTQEASEFLKVSCSTLYRYCENGSIPHIKKGFGLRFRKEELEKWLSQDRRRSRLAEGILKNALTKPPPGVIDKAKGGVEVAIQKKGRRHFAYGSIYQRSPGGSWSIDFYGPGNERVQKVAKGASTWQEAHEALRHAVYDSYFGQVQKKQRNQDITFESLADLYIKDWAEVNKSGSWKTDQYKIKEMKKFFKGRSAASITSQDIEQYKAYKRAQGRKLTTVNKHVQVLSKLFNCGISWGYLKLNPCKGVKKYPEEPFRRTRVLSLEEEPRLLKAIGPAHIKSMIKILLNSGLRRKELFQLTWDRVDFKKRQLFVQETKTSRSRHVPMNKTVFNELRERHWSRSDDGLVFRNPKTGRTYVCIRKTFNRACKKAGIKNLNLLDIRRTFASRLLEAGADIITVQQLLGHTSVKTTQIYTVSNADQKFKAVSLLDPNRGVVGDKLVTISERLLVNNVFSVN